MNIFIVFRTALSSIGANKLRAGLTLLGIVIGVVAVITLMAAGKGAQEEVTENIQALGSNLLYVRPGSAGQGFIRPGSQDSNLTLEDAYAVLDPVYTPSVEAVAPEITTYGNIVANQESVSAQILGVTPEYEYVRNFPVASGEFISPAHVAGRSDVVVLGT